MQGAEGQAREGKGRKRAEAVGQEGVPVTVAKESQRLTVRGDSKLVTVRKEADRQTQGPFQLEMRRLRRS